MKKHLPQAFHGGPDDIRIVIHIVGRNIGTARAAKVLVSRIGDNDAPVRIPGK